MLYPYLLNSKGGKIESEGFKPIVLVYIGGAAAIIFLYWFVLGSVFKTDRPESTESENKIVLPTEIRASGSGQAVIDFASPTGSVAADVAVLDFSTPTPAPPSMLQEFPIPATRSPVEVLPASTERIEESTKYPAAEENQNQHLVKYQGICPDGCERVSVVVEVFEYYPPRGDLDCLEFVDGVCLSDMYSGANWRLPVYHDFAVACPDEWSIYSYIDIDGLGRFQCLDRGSSVRCENGICRIAVLSDFEYSGRYDAVVYLWEG